MPTLRVMSIYREQKRKHIADLRHARDELERFRASLPLRFGPKLAGVIRQEAWFRDSGIFGKEVSADAEDAIEAILSLKRSIRAVCRQIHTPDCWCREGPHGVSVWETMGMSWDDVWRMVKENKLSLSAVLKLLRIVRETEQIMPTEERLGRFAVLDGVEKWRRFLTRKRARLLRLLTTAAELEEEVRADYLS